MNIIVIGNGLSAINFIDAFRKEDAESSITTFSDETYYPYNRTRIPDCISGEKKEAHVIDSNKCIKCGSCWEACPSKWSAVIVE